MKTYKLSSEGFESVERKARNQTIIIFLILIAVMLFIVAPELSREPLSLASVPISFILIAAAAYAGIRKSSKGLQNRWSSYELSLIDDVVIRRQAQTPDIEIRRNQVVSLQETSSGDIIIKTDDRRKFIVVPASLNGREEVREHLAKWQKIELLTERPILKILPIVTALGTIGAFATTVASQNIRVVLPVGFLLIAVLLWSLIEIQRSPHVEARIKRSAWLVLLPLLGVAVKIISLLM